MKIKISSCLLAFLLGAVLSVVPALAADSLESVYKAAKAEGELVYWCPIAARVFRGLNKAFSQEFPGIKISHFQIRPDDFAPRAAAEASQGRVSFDLGDGRFGAIIPLIERDLIQSFNDWTRIFKDLNPAAVSKDGKFIARSDLAYVVAYNTNLVKPNEIPESWEALLDPKWKGKIIFDPRGVALAYVGVKWGKDKTLDYIRKLREQNLIYVKGGTAISQQLAAGAGYVAVGSYVHRILRDKDRGAPIDWAKKVSPVGAAGQYSFVMKGAKHPNTARLFAAWLVSKKGQEILQQDYWYGSMLPGSDYRPMKVAERNGVEISRESLENIQTVDGLNEAIVKELGVLR